MTTQSTAGWRPLQRSSELALVGENPRSLHRAVARQQLVRLRRGVFVDAAEWPEVSERDKYLLRMRAVAATRKVAPVFSHQSAAILWGLPMIGSLPREVHLMAAGRRGVHSKNGVAWHHDRLGDDDVVECDGMHVTSLLRTLVDLARTSPFLSAVTSLDVGTKSRFLLPNGAEASGISREEVIDRLAADGPVAGSRAARIAVTFSDNRSGSPGESLSRGQIFLCGFPVPELQVSFVSPAGIEDIVDYRWQQKQGAGTLRLLGEFDGYVKYTRNEFTDGRPIEEIVWTEKQREDRLRATTQHGMARWIWDVALRAQNLRTLLLEAGLRPER